MKSMKCCFALTIVSALTVAGCSDWSRREMADPRIADPSSPIVFLTDPTEPPFSYRDKSGKIVGKDIEIARRIAAKMEKDLVVKDVPFNDIMPTLKAGKADIGIASIIITPARGRDVDFSVPYADGGMCFLYRKDGKKPRMSQIANLRVGVQIDSIEDIYLCRHGGDPVRFPDLRKALTALDGGDIDAVFFDVPQLKHLAETSGGRLLVTPPETLEKYGVAVDKRRPDVLAAANAVIREGGAE